MFSETAGMPSAIRTLTVMFTNGGQISAQNSSKYFKQLLLDFRKEVKKSRLLITNDLLLSES